MASHFFLAPLGLRVAQARSRVHRGRGPWGVPVSRASSRPALGQSGLCQGQGQEGFRGAAGGASLCPHMAAAPLAGPKGDLGRFEGHTAALGSLWSIHRRACVSRGTHVHECCPPPPSHPHPHPHAALGFGLLCPSHPPTTAALSWRGGSPSSPPPAPSPLTAPSTLLLAAFIFYFSQFKLEKTEMKRKKILSVFLASKSTYYIYIYL